MDAACQSRKAELERAAPVDAKGVWLREGDRVFLCGTIGAAFDAWQRRLSVLSAADAYFSQQIGLAAVEREMDALEAEARASLAPGERLLPRRSPGYGKMPLSASREIVERLKATRRIGVSVTDADLLVPSKSVTAVCEIVRPAKPKVAVEGRLPRTLALSRGEIRAAAAFFASRAAARVQTPFREVTVVLQDDDFSAEVHRAINGVEGPTDAITQRYDALPGEPPGVYGEVYVNCDRALAAAPRRRDWSPAKELLLYVAHGMDHLSGADDLDPKGYDAMRRRELAWLREWERRA